MMLEARLYLLQRLTAAIMAPMVVTHIATMLYVSRHELTAEAILERSQASPLIGLFYAAFVITAAIHAPLGLRKIMIEWLNLKRANADRFALLLFLLFLALGLRSVWAVAGATST